jgi:hypothetical protein
MRPPSAWRALASGCLLAMAGLLADSAAATATAPAAQAHGHAAPAAAGPEAEVQALVRRYHAAQREVLRQQLCLMTKGCLTDEGRLLDAMEAGKRSTSALAERAQAGDVLAAHERGVIALQAAGQQLGRTGLDTDTQYPGSFGVLRRRWAQEQATAERYLGMAALAGHPPACLALAQTLAGRVPQPEPDLVARLFRCAVNGFSAQGQRRQALEAYAAMRQVLPVQDPALVEVHALVLRHQTPERPWRRVEPAEAEALRRGVAP